MTGKVNLATLAQTARRHSFLYKPPQAVWAGMCAVLAHLFEVINPFITFVCVLRVAALELGSGQVLTGLVRAPMGPHGVLDVSCPGWTDES